MLLLFDNLTYNLPSTEISLRKIQRIRSNKLPGTHVTESIFGTYAKYKTRGFRAGLPPAATTGKIRHNSLSLKDMFLTNIIYLTLIDNNYHKGLISRRNRFEGRTSPRS